MNLKILSTIAAISATTTYASSLTCGDVKSLYQDGACCAANDQSCVKTLSIAADSSGFTTLSNTGELSIDLSGKADQTTVSELQIIVGTKADQTDLVSGLALKADNSALSTTQSDVTALQSSVSDLETNKADQSDLLALQTTVGTKATQSDLTDLQTTVGTKATQSDLTDLQTTVGTKANQTDLTALQTTVDGKEDKIQVLTNSQQTSYGGNFFLDGDNILRTKKYFVGDVGLQSNGDLAVSGTTYLNGAVNFANKLTIGQVDWGYGPNKIKEAIDNQYEPANFDAACPKNYHGFKSLVKTHLGTDTWEMVLEGGDHGPSWHCVVQQVRFNDAELTTMGNVKSNGVILTSDSRIKKDIVDADIEDALQKVRDIELKEYAYNNPRREGEKTVGFIAQQVQEVYPDAIYLDTDENSIWNEAGERVKISDLLRVKKDKIFALHHGALQYLDAKIATLEARLAALEPQPTP